MGGSDAVSNCRQTCKRNRTTCRCFHHKGFDRFLIVSNLIRQSNCQPKPPISIHNLTDFFAAEGHRNDLLNISDTYPHAGDSFPVDVDLEHGNVVHLFDFDVGRAGYLPHQSRNLIRLALQLGEVFANDFDPHVCLHTRNDLGKPQFNRLTEVVSLTGDFLDLRINLRDELLFGQALSPLRFRLDREEAIGETQRHWICSDLGSARASHHGDDFRYLKYLLFVGCDELQGLLHINGPDPDGLNDERPLIKLRHKL